MAVTRSQKTAALLCFLILFHALLPAQEPIKKIPESEDEIRAMEKKIWMLLNEERSSSDLFPLILSPSLSDIARKHSHDMAERGELSHQSSSGNRLADRLKEARIHYIEAGENIALSETFVEDFIHEHLIQSPEHKENILNPDYQEVGVGIVFKKNKGYYITQDFVHPLYPRTVRDVQALIQKNVNARRRSLSLPPLVYLEHREAFAQSLSKHKAKGLNLPPIPEQYGETLALFLVTPSLSDESLVFKAALNPRFDRAALGIWFAPTADYPGGAYHLTLMLFASNRLEGLSPRERKHVVLSQIIGLIFSTNSAFPSGAVWGAVVFD